MPNVLVRDGHLDAEAQTHSGRTPREDGGRGGGHAHNNRGTPRTAGGHRKLEGFLLRAFGGSTALPTPCFPPSRLQNCERIHFSCFKFVVISYGQPWGLNTATKPRFLHLYHELSLSMGRSSMRQRLRLVLHCILSTSAVFGSRRC